MCFAPPRDRRSISLTKNGGGNWGLGLRTWEVATAQEYTKRFLHRCTWQQRHQKNFYYYESHNKIFKTGRKGWHNIGDQGSADVLILGPLQTERNPEPLTFSETRPDKQDTFVFVFCPSSLPQLFAIVLWQQEVTRVNQTTHKYHPMPYSYNSVQNIYVNLFKIRNKTLLADNLLGNISLILGGKENPFFLYVSAWDCILSHK